MTVNSWLHLSGEDAHYALPQALRERDPLAARDCGWVDQMLPFVHSHAGREGWIIDPFCGFGSTLVAAWAGGVRAAGVELNADRAQLARERLALAGIDPHDCPVVTGSVAQPAVRAELARAEQADAPPRRFNLCLTNVPYFGAPAICSAAEPGADSPIEQQSEQLYGQCHYEPYLRGLREVFNGVHALLEPGGWCVVMAQNLRLGDTFVPLAWDVARLLSERFVLHEERVLIYDRPGTAGDAAAPPGTPTNRAHEYALICRKQASGLNLADARKLLDQLAQSGFEFALYGSLARWLHGSRQTPPNDIDLLCPPGDAQISKLLQWLEAAGFRIESWNTAVKPPVSVEALAYRHYFRARRVDRDGQALQLDVAAASDRVVFDQSVAAARQRTPRAGIECVSYPVLC